MNLLLLQPKDNPREDTLLHLWAKDEISFLFHAGANEAEGEDGWLFYDLVVVVDVRAYFLNDAFPLIARELHKANSRHNLI